MNSSNNNIMIKALAFEKAILEILKNDNPSLNENYSEKHNEKCLNHIQYDAVSFGALYLQSFEVETIFADKIVIEIKAGTPRIEIISRFYECVKSDCDAIVFFLAGKKPKGIEEKIRSSAKCRVYFIDAEQLKRNKTIYAILKKFDEYIVSDNNILIEDNYSLLYSIKNNLAFAIGAGCSRDSHISDWKTLSKALGYELLYTIVNTKESNYKNKLITDALTDSLFECFDNSSALDAVYNSYKPSTPFDKCGYWLSIKNVLYMSYDSPYDAKKPLMNAIASCINRRNIETVINYNFDSVLEQNMKDNYKSKEEEILNSKTVINGCIVNHVHGYIPYDYNGKTIVRNFIFTDKEYYDNMMEPTSFTNTTQKEILQSKNVIFVGVSFTDSNMKKILRERVSAGYSNNIFAFLKLPDFKFEGTNNKLFENKYKLLYEHYFDSLGVKVLWVHSFSEIPEKIEKI
ncbi:MAG: SIR2 family protein [Clostridia bacterium]|nr:SIR2 family protein [Clostridia bacterium]